jgi:RNA polymerase sigma-32 factor
MDTGPRSSIPTSLQITQPAARALALLDVQAERELTQRFQAGDRRAGDRLLLAHVGLVLMVAREYRRWDVPMDDIVQQGNLGLLKAAARFDPERGCRLSTYAAYWIRAEIREYVMRSYRVVRLGTTKAERRAVRLYRRTGESDPNVLAKHSGLSPALAERLLPLLTAREASVDQPGASGASPLDRLASLAPSPEEDAIRHQRSRQIRQEIDRFLRGLPARERFILRSRWIRETPATLEQLGTRFGISKERVRQLEARALANLRDRLLACRRLDEAC